MAGNAWDGYVWVDGWPVTPPRMQQRTQPQPQPVPDPAPQPVPVPPPPMQPPSQHQSAQTAHNSENQVILAQVENRTGQQLHRY
jgi:colicin import membrane protein